MERSLRETLRVLVVEDNPVVREVLVEVVEEEFDCVLEAENGLEALQVVGARPPDLVLLDLSMPHMDGFETCRRMRTIAGMSDVPIVVLTAHRSEKEANAAFEAGATDYLVKPFTNGQLRARLRTHVLSRSRHDHSSATNVCAEREREQGRLREPVAGHPECAA